MMHINSRCRDCKSAKLVKFLDLGSQALANSFVAAENLDKREPRYPLEVYFCEDCNLAQLIHVVDKKELFLNYVYFSAGMPRISPHWQRYAEEVMARFLTDSEDFVFEIASNDGILLKFFKDKAFRILGVDPAQNIVPIARSLGVPTLTAFFTEAVAKDVLQTHGSAKAILANNVVAHIDDHHDLCRAVKLLLHPAGVFVIEAPYLVDMFENLTYDTVYHEHLSYAAVRPLQTLFQKFGLEIFDVRLVSVQGKSLRLFVGHRGAHPIDPSVAELIQKELGYHMDDVESYIELAKRVAASKERLVELVDNLKKQGRKIAAYGAPAKGNTLLNYCKIGTDSIDYAIDDLPSKQGLYTPGTHIPVVSREYAEKHPPDYYVLLAWNYAQTVFDREQKFRGQGGKFIIPVGDDINII